MGGSELSLGTLVKKQFTPSKIIFHILFWGMHWGVFAFGWYDSPSLSAIPAMYVKQSLTRP